MLSPDPAQAVTTSFPQFPNVIFPYFYSPIHRKPLFVPSTANFPHSFFLKLYIFWLIWTVISCNNLSCIDWSHLFPTYISSRPSSFSHLFISQLSESWRLSGGSAGHTEIANGYIWVSQETRPANNFIVWYFLREVFSLWSY